MSNSRISAAFGACALIIGLCSTGWAQPRQRPPVPLRNRPPTALQSPASKFIVDRHRPREYLIGVYYFSGWWPQQPNKYTVENVDWRSLYMERIPLLGMYNTPATMDNEIAEASYYGVDFFQFLWYYPGTTDKPNADADKLNAGIGQFLGSRLRIAMNFTVEYVNHPPFGISGEREWEAACQTWCRLMQDASYLKVGERAVFKVHGLQHFLNECDGDLDRVKKRIDKLRETARQMGLGEILVGAGITAGPTAKGNAVTPFDYLTTYMDMPNVEREEKPYPYNMLIEHAQQIWQQYAEESEKPYVPYVPAGWDPRPWKDPRPSFAMPTPTQWREALVQVKSALDRNPRLGLPLPEDRRRKMLLIYAWNEYGEGGIIAPTRGEQRTKLEGIEAVFGKGMLAISRPASP